MRQADAQSPNAIPADLPAGYLMFSAGGGMLFPKHPGSAFSTSFKYTSTSVATGATTTQTFSGSSGGFFPVAIAGDMVDVAAVFRHNKINLGLGYNEDMHGTPLNQYLKAGYGYIFHCGRLQVQPSVDLYVMFDGPAKMGFINNSGVNISLLGYTAQSQFTTSSNQTNFFGVSSDQTYHAANLEIDYMRTSFMAEPKLALGIFLWQKMYVGIEAGWMLQIAQISNIRLLQNAADNAYLVGRVYIADKGSLGGPGVGINIGYRLGRRKAQKMKKANP
jgi:hypothetical protein